MRDVGMCKWDVHAGCENDRVYCPVSEHGMGRAGRSRQVSTVKLRRFWLKRRRAATEGPSLSCASSPRSASCETRASDSGRGCCAANPAVIATGLTYASVQLECLAADHGEDMSGGLTWGWLTNLCWCSDAQSLQPRTLRTALRCSQAQWSSAVAKARRRRVAEQGEMEAHLHSSLRAWPRADHPRVAQQSKPAAADAVQR